jgi:hypothetical protein
MYPTTIHTCAPALAGGVGRRRRHIPSSSTRMSRRRPGWSRLGVCTLSSTRMAPRPSAWSRRRRPSTWPGSPSTSTTESRWRCPAFCRPPWPCPLCAWGLHGWRRGARRRRRFQGPRRWNQVCFLLLSFLNEIRSWCHVTDNQTLFDSSHWNCTFWKEN